MKQLLTLLLLVLGTVAFANNKEQSTPSPSAAESHQIIDTCTKKINPKAQKNNETETKNTTLKEEAPQKEKTPKGVPAKACKSVEASGLGLSGYFVDFVHESNIKLVKLFL
jgi:hypothetical protein